jgi:hypothetical protein
LECFACYEKKKNASGWFFNPQTYKWMNKV